MSYATNSAKIDDFIDKLILSPYKSFYADLVVKHTGLEAIPVFEYLLSLTKPPQQKLILKWEVICPIDSCYKKIKQFNKLEDILNKYIYCPDCGEEIKATEDNIIPVFKFNPDYRVQRRNTLLKKRQNMEI